MSKEVLSLLIEERDRLNQAIAALQGSAPRRGRPPGSGAKKAAKKRRRRRMSAAQREALSKRMKSVWEKRRKAAKK